MRKTQYYAAALKAAEAVPVIAKKRAGVEGVEYDIEEYSTPDAYDDPFPPAATWGPAWFAFGKSWKTIKGAQRFLALQLQCHGKGLADYARQFRIVARKSEV